MGLVRRAAEAATPDLPAGERRLDDRDRDGLLVRLRSADAEERRRAVVDLEGEDAVGEHFLAVLEEETGPAVREALLAALAAADDPETGRVLASWLRDEQALRRNEAVTALQTMPQTMAVLVQEGLLTDPDDDVRVLAVMALSVVPHPEVPRWLAPVVSTDASAQVVAAAVDVAVTLDDELAATFAATASARFPTDPYLRFLAGMAAGR
jgi:hypothetical protein